MSQLKLDSKGRQIFSKYLLRHIDEDGAEYFTVIATGRSGMSHNGLARFLDLNQVSISTLVRKVRKANPTNNKLPECLKPFAGLSLTLRGYSDQQGRDILDDGFCAAVVEYYAQWSKVINQESKIKAKQALSMIQHLGMRLFIHKKTGWQPNYKRSKSDEFELEFAAHNERLTVREILKKELHPELISAVQQWQRKHHASRKIYSDTLEAMNLMIQGIKSREIKTNNNLPKSASIRDYFETRPLIDYSALNRLVANLIRDRDMHPVEAVHEASLLYLSTKYVPQPVPIVENVYKAEKRLQAKKKNRELSAGTQLSLPLSM
jgi:hypothetical protein